MTPLKWFYGFYKKNQWKMIIGLILVTIVSVLAVVKPYLSGIIVDDVIGKGRYDLLPYLIGFMLLVTLVRSIARYYSQVLFEESSHESKTIIT